MTLIIHDKVRRTAEVMGQGQWISELPERVAEIAERWQLTIGDVPGNATEAFVALARTQAGEACALKMVIPGIDPKRQQIRVLRGANGNGYVKLLRADENANILLLERLGPQLHVSGLSDEAMIEVICATLKLAWMPPPEGPAFVSGAAKAAELGKMISSNWSRFNKPCAERTFDLALRYAGLRRAAFDPAKAVLVHGDAHEWNTLAAPGSPTGYKFVDPDGAFAERAFDLAIPMREWRIDVLKQDRVKLARARCALLCRLTGIEPQPIWEWSLLQLVSNGLSLLEIDAFDSAAIEFSMADAVAEGFA